MHNAQVANVYFIYLEALVVLRMQLLFDMHAMLL